MATPAAPGVAPAQQPAQATTYEYGGQQQAYNPYDAYSNQQAGYAYQWPQGGAQPQQQQQPAGAGQYGAWNQQEGYNQGQYNYGAWNQQQQAWGQQNQWYGGQQQQGWNQQQQGGQQAWPQQGAQQQQQPADQQAAAPGTEPSSAPAAAEATQPAQGGGGGGGGALPAAIPDPGGYGTWEPQKDPGSGKVYWVNHALQKTSWEPPAQPPAAAQASAGGPPAAAAAAAAGWGAAQGQPGGYQQAGYGQQWGAGAGGVAQQQQQWHAYNAAQAAQAGAPGHNVWGAQQPQQQPPTLHAGAQAAGGPAAPHQQQPKAAGAFSWTAPKPKPAAQAPEAYKWDDGRDRDRGDRDRDHGSNGRYDEEYPALGSAPSQKRVHGAPGSAVPPSPGRAQPAKKEEGAPGQWPPKLQKFVENAFAQCQTEYERTCMQNTLKSIIQNATQNSRLWSTDWALQPLPRVANASGKKEEKQQPQQQLTKKQKRKQQASNAMGVDGDSAQERAAREKRLRRFVDMERGVHGQAQSVQAGGADDEMKFISSEAIVGTCMTMEKIYIRLQSMPDPETVRPERVLIKWAERLKDKYEADEADWDWISDQFKALRQDMIIQHHRNANFVQICETNGRLTLLENDWAEFYKVSSLLVDLYKDTGATENLPEFLQYRIFYWMLYNKAVDLMKEFRLLSPELKQHPFIMHAWKVHNSIELSDFVSFFRLYEETPNLGKCVLKIIRDKMRDKALRVVLRSYKPSVPTEFLQKRLGFRVTGGDDLDLMLNASNNQDDDDDDWEGFAIKCCITSTDDDADLVDVKATSEALSEYERRVAAQKQD